MLRTTVFLTCFAVFSSILISCAGSSEIRLISPMGAAARSIIPGWGQFYTHDRLAGVIIFLSVGILGGGAIQADAISRDVYNNKYEPAILAGSPEADSYYDRSNQYYKLSRFLRNTVAGIWAYSILDAYVDAHIYNARQQSRMLDIDEKGLQQLKLISGSSKAGSGSSLRSRASVILALAEAKQVYTRCSMLQSDIQYSDRLFSSRGFIRGD